MKLYFGYENTTKDFTFTWDSEADPAMPDARAGIDESVVELNLIDYDETWQDAFLHPWKFNYDDVGLVPVIKEGA